MKTLTSFIFCVLIFLGTLLTSKGYAVPNFTGKVNTASNDWPETSNYSSGDIIVLPTEPGDIIATIYDNIPIFWNREVKWFTYLDSSNIEKIRNYQTSVAIPIPFNLSEGNYLLYEIQIEPVLEVVPGQVPFPFLSIEKYKDIADVDNWHNWRRVRTFPIKVTCPYSFCQ